MTKMKEMQRTARGFVARGFVLALCVTSTGCMLFAPPSQPLEGVIRESFSVRVNLPQSPASNAMETEDAEPIGLSDLAAAENYTAEGRGEFVVSRIRLGPDVSYIR